MEKVLKGQVMNRAGFIGYVEKVEVESISYNRARLILSFDCRSEMVLGKLLEEFADPQEWRFCLDWEEYEPSPTMNEVTTE